MLQFPELKLSPRNPSEIFVHGSPTGSFAWDKELRCIHILCEDNTVIQCAKLHLEKRKPIAALEFMQYYKECNSVVLENEFTVQKSEYVFPHYDK